MRKIFSLLMLLILAVPAVQADYRDKQFERRAYNATAFLYEELPGENTPHFLCTASVFAVLAPKDYLLETASHCVSVKKAVLDPGFGGFFSRRPELPTDYFYGHTKDAKFFVSFTGPISPIYDDATVYQNSDSEMDDVAILEVKTSWKIGVVDLGDEGLNHAGDTIFNVGCPGGFGKLETWGHISLLVDGTGDPEDPWPGAILANINIAPGSSGSPVYDERQQTIIGIVVGMFLVKDLPAVTVIEPVSHLRRALYEHVWGWRAALPPGSVGVPSPPGIR